MKNRFLFPLIHIVSLLPLFGQDTASTGLSRAIHFGPPLDIPLSLAGNFGEIRNNHFHAGLDLKTESVEGKNVYAVAEGYVSRIKITTNGYGKVLCITHPNGYTSAYAHLQRMSDKIEEYLKKEQYKKETFEIELYPGKKQLRVDSGEVVAFSGNTGGSSGPHLHFEIRDKKMDYAFNPMLFGFNIKDDISPVIRSLGVYPLSDSTLINGNHKELIFPVGGGRGNYRVGSRGPIVVKGPVGFGIETLDYTNGSGNTCGTFIIELAVDGSTIYSSKMECIGFHESRYINSHVDFYSWKKRGRPIQRSFLQPNNKLGIYSNVANRGIVEFKDDSVHVLKYLVNDSYGNTSTLTFKVHSAARNGKKHEEIAEVQNTEPDSFPVFDSVLIDTSSATGNLISMNTTTSNQLSNHLIATSCCPEDSLPEKDTLALSDSVAVLLISSEPQNMMYYKAGEYNSFETKNIIIGIPSEALYDDIEFEYSTGKRIPGAKSPVHFIHNNLVPVHVPITVSIRTDSIKKEVVDKAVVVGFNANKVPVSEGGTWSKGYITAKVKNLGAYTVLIDTVPPGISKVTISPGNAIVARIGDGLSGIKTYKGTIDDKWVLMEYDYKTHRLVYTFDSTRVNKGGRHNFRLVVSDERGNSSEYKAGFGW